MPNILPKAKQVQIARCLSEGLGIRATARAADCSKNTVNSLQLKLGEAAGDAQDLLFRDLDCRRIQCDEIWSFVHCKAKTARRNGKENTTAHGDIWLWTAIDADSKLVPSWLCGYRDAETAEQFISDLASRLKHRIQLSSDCNAPYLEAVEGAWGMDVDFGQLLKVYGDDPQPQKRYSPAKLRSITKIVRQGDPDREHISTSYSESHNQKIRQHMRRYTRLTAAHSKKERYHVAAVGMFMYHYNLIKPHETLTKRQGSNCTPAMAVGVATKPYSFDDLVDLIR